jgi:hypothetical protein
VVKPVIKPATATKKPVVKKSIKRLTATATKKPVVKKSVKKTVSGKKQPPNVKSVEGSWT